MFWNELSSSTSPSRPLGLGKPSTLRHKYLYQAPPHTTLNVKQESTADFLLLLCTQTCNRSLIHLLGMDHHRNNRFSVFRDYGPFQGGEQRAFQSQRGFSGLTVLT